MVHIRIENSAITTDEFKPYLRTLSKKMDYKPFALFMDQLAVHRRKDVFELCKELGIEIIFCPSYSPDLNPIESCFSHVKRIFKNDRLNALANGRDFDMEHGVRKAFKFISVELVT